MSTMDLSKRGWGLKSGILLESGCLILALRLRSKMNCNFKSQAAHRATAVYHCVPPC